MKLKIEKNYAKNKTSFKEANFLPTWVYRGDGAKKMHILFPAQWGNDKEKLPMFLTTTHQQKMIEAFEDTKKILTNNNPQLLLYSIKQ